MHVPYKSSANALIEVVGGQINLILGSMLPTLPHIKSGKINGIAVTTAQRWTRVVAAAGSKPDS
jgi:tripartite-type tricarboxylate transporter receptor subunit TctC